MQDVISDTLSFLDMLRVTGGISVLARPMPERYRVCEGAPVIPISLFSMMAVSFEVDRMSCQSCACVSSSPQVLHTNLSLLMLSLSLH